jgi:Flp pilus assembly protein TadD
MSLLTPWTTLPSLIGIIGLLCYAVWQPKRQPIASFAILWYFGNLALESSVIGLEIIFEHRTYLPSVFVIYAFVFYLYKMIKSKIVVIGCLVAVSVVFAAWTRERNEVWSDAVSLWTDCTMKSPGKARPYNNLGVAYYLRGNLEDAIEQYRNSIALDPGYANPHYNLGIALGQKHDFEQAMSHLQTAIELEPRNYHAHNNLGVALSLAGRFNEAIDHFKQAIRLKPDYAEAFNNLGISYRRMGEIDKAVHNFQEAIRLDPNHAEAHNNLGYAYSLQGKNEAARQHYQRALEIDPRYRTALNNLKDLALEESAISEGDPRNRFK